MILQFLLEGREGGFILNSFQSVANFSFPAESVRLKKSRNHGFRSDLSLSPGQRSSRGAVQGDIVVNVVHEFFRNGVARGQGQVLQGGVPLQHLHDGLGTVLADAGVLQLQRGQRVVLEQAPRQVLHPHVADAVSVQCERLKAAVLGDPLTDARPASLGRHPLVGAQPQGLDVHVASQQLANPLGTFVADPRARQVKITQDVPAGQVALGDGGGGAVEADAVGGRLRGFRHSLRPRLAVQALQTSDQLTHADVSKPVTVQPAEVTPHSHLLNLRNKNTSHCVCGKDNIYIYRLL